MVPGSLHRKDYDHTQVALNASVLEFPCAVVTIANPHNALIHHAVGIAPYKDGIFRVLREYVPRLFHKEHRSPHLVVNTALDTMTSSDLNACLTAPSIAGLPGHFW